MGDDLKGMDVLIFSQMFTKDYFLAKVLYLKKSVQTTLQKVLLYSSNKIRKTKNEHLHVVCQNLNYL